MPKAPKACWSCGASRASTGALCPACGKASRRLPRTSRTSSPSWWCRRSYELDEGGLEETFRALSRKLHPDRFARATPRERRFSLEQTTLLNDAYRTVRIR